MTKLESIILEYKNSWGNDRYYPRCSLSEIICELLNQKCFTKDQMRMLEEKGFKIQLKKS